ncbi:DUF2959 domain-containing protein [Aestuariibacter sp. AA17]|uniref:DUF2959 domain-containing protein n=1 Tax=Fluctibacter corallii TaxID=2984329 RepID=A0ABT3A6I2_9ALTE|nr:DUF2959 domain-containing protein [Aestuariibacter sp. AA17]MCV2884298.1 DUF2959 domain-containing protein [Aestuariibacter sp. AA17]
MRFVFIATLLSVLVGCQSAYYAAWEKLGVEKRDILVDRVETAKDSQEDAQEQFSSALEQFSVLINFDGGELEDVYTQLKDEFDASQAAANTVSERINKVESVAEALFDEWQDELDKFTNDKMRRESQQQLRETQRRYKALLSSMRRAEEKMAPVLSSLQDNVLYLKHNLNASAIGALQGEFNNIRRDINALIADMNVAIEQSNQFIQSMK